MSNDDRSVLKGALAGLAGGLAGSASKIVAEKLVPPRVHGEPQPPVVLAEQVAGHPLPPAAQKASSQGIHWAFGAIAGALYGAIMEYRPPTSLWRGVAFGVTLNKMTHRKLLPALGLSAPVSQQQPQEQFSEWITHIVYGATTEITRRAVRKRL